MYFDKQHVSTANKLIWLSITIRNTQGNQF